MFQPAYVTSNILTSRLEQFYSKRESIDGGISHFETDCGSSTPVRRARPALGKIGDFG
jgi:hypothetical protein